MYMMIVKYSNENACSVRISIFLLCCGVSFIDTSECWVRAPLARNSARLARKFARSKGARARNAQKKFCSNFARLDRCSKKIYARARSARFFYARNARITLGLKHKKSIIPNQ